MAIYQHGGREELIRINQCGAVCSVAPFANGTPALKDA